MLYIYPHITHSSHCPHCYTPNTPTAIVCPALTLAFGTIVYDPVSGPFMVAATATYTCNIGYSLSAAAVRTCTEDDRLDTVGVWEPAASTCDCECIHVYVATVYCMHLRTYVRTYISIAVSL